MRKEQILDAAIDTALRDGYSEMTRDAIAAQAGVSIGLVNFYFGDMQKLRASVMRRSIKHEILPIIMQGIACRDPVVKSAPLELKIKALRSFEA